MSIADVPAFARGGGTWLQTYTRDGTNTSAPTEIFVVLPDVSLHCKRRWWGRRWDVVGTSDRPWGEAITLYVARDRMEHGFWRDVLVDEEPFDTRYFIYCDVPALARVLLGPATRRALDASYDRKSTRTLALHAHGTVIETESIAAFGNADAAMQHAAVHRALAEDAARLDAHWQRIAVAFGGAVSRAWPPRVSFERAGGEVAIELRWQRPDAQTSTDWHAATHSLQTVVLLGDSVVPVAGIASEVELRAAVAQAVLEQGLQDSPYR